MRETFSGTARAHLVLQVVSQVNVLGRVRVVQQFSISRIHEVDAELEPLLRRILRDKVRNVRVLCREGEGEDRFIPVVLFANRFMRIVRFFFLPPLLPLRCSAVDRGSSSERKRPGRGG